ncbi:phosphotransferase enzyme family protein [Aspergillus homomorphus CBS 101889]|uniref:Phosphotransferase enzyme family protein n=1 Tax=Aspergillus homomorphus (strain CBS 101889) TaxID=1450537 RepID=A0A395HT76_ASPHC|nr:phosphotransferase enzyme family protein [Aspergillus homomorphus CBS 101889]RAL11141.1 phosphotransferase enzyme family protein [Aspergillus homomorphus CBS 101889]
MEKLPGRPLGNEWFELSDRERLKVLLQLVRLEARPHAIELPASGSIYYAGDLPSDSPRIALPDSDLCIGPSAALEWWFAERVLLRVNRGPCTCEDPIDVLRNPALKELAWLRAYGRPRFPFERAYREFMDYHFLRPVLRHPDLQPNNIFISNNLDIVGLIDWQHASALPLFLAAGIRNFFQNYDDPASLELRPPPAPDLDDMDVEEKANTLHNFQRRHIHFFYLAFTQRFNEPRFRVMDRATNMLMRRVFSHAGEPWEGNNIPLQADLTLLTKSWHNYSTNPCPIPFPPAKADSIMHVQGIQEEVDLQLKQNLKLLCARARQIKVDGLASLDTDYEREMTDRHWPFDDHDEDE